MTIDPFIVLPMIAASSYETGSTVVANCFRHAGFTVQCARWRMKYTIVSA